MRGFRALMCAASACACPRAATSSVAPISLDHAYPIDFVSARRVASTERSPCARHALRSPGPRLSDADRKSHAGRVAIAPDSPPSAVPDTARGPPSETSSQVHQTAFCTTPWRRRESPESWHEEYTADFDSQRRL